MHIIACGIIYHQTWRISPSLGAGFLTAGELNSTYYRRFVKDFSIKTANLRKLLQRDAKFVWNSIHQQEFDFLKNALTSAPILAFPNMQKEFILTTDACTSGIAFILSQLDDQGREHVICYGGRGLRKSEINWSISELECLAIIEGTRCYHQYLVGRQNFAIYKSKPVAVILFWFTNFYRVAYRISVIIHYCWIQAYNIYICLLYTSPSPRD